MKTIRRILIMVLIIAVVSAPLSACSLHNAKCKVTEMEFVDTVDVDQVYYNWEGYDNVKIVIDVSLAEKFTADGAKAGSDDFRKAITKKITEGCSLTYNGKEAERVWAYWPKKAGAYSAKHLTLFYTVPEGTPLSEMEFKMDGKALGDASYQYSYQPK